MKTIRINPPDGPISARISLPLSKSECNRAQVIAFLSKGKVRCSRISEADDSRLMESLLVSESEILDAGPAGTVMRFLSAVFAFQPGRKILTGSGRMKERPIGGLVKALNSIGGDIRFLEKVGFPPLEIHGVDPLFAGGKVKFLENISSQFLSALAMVAPTLGKGLEIEFPEDQVSESYFRMTLSMLKQCGIQMNEKGNSVFIPKQEFTAAEIQVRPDWSAAGYWFLMAALRPGSDIFLNDLTNPSLQSDAIISEWMKKLGVNCVWESDGCRILSGHHSFEKKKHEWNFLNSPDLFQTMAALVAGLNHTAKFSGLQTLRAKETDRIQAMVEALQLFGVRMETGNDFAFIQPSSIHPPQSVVPVFDDHRMAMSLAPLSLVTGPIEMQNPDTVKKSYPGFWNDLQSAGFVIDYVQLV